jgi:hypothetical protein
MPIDLRPNLDASLHQIMQAVVTVLAVINLVALIDRLRGKTLALDAPVSKKIR